MEDLIQNYKIITRILTRDQSWQKCKPVGEINEPDKTTKQQAFNNDQLELLNDDDLKTINGYRLKKLESNKHSIRQFQINSPEF